MLKRISIDELDTTLKPAVDVETLEATQAILDEIRLGGESALLHAIERYEGRANDPLCFGRDDFLKAVDLISSEQRELLKRVARRIERFSTAQRDSLQSVSMPIAGGTAGHHWFPLQTAGCYVPGGRFPLVSSLLMTVVTARTAGVENVWVASPVASPVMLAAAEIAGADYFLWCGGAQAIAAFAYGVGPVPVCDVVVGPGNRWVTAAKFLVSDRLRIDMLAGPSELLVVADDSAEATVVAADLLAQAEHDVDARPILITNSARFANAVDRELDVQLSQLDTRDTARAAMQNGFALVVGNWNEAVDACQKIAPEHLEIQVADPEVLASRLTTCGCLFIGEPSAEVLGDYGAGPNHVLPTGGTARFASGLAVDTFMRRQTWLKIVDLPAAQETVQDAVALAELEGLSGHATSARWRVKPS